MCSWIWFFVSQVTFVVKAVSSFSAALFLLQVERCERNGMPEPCNTLMPSPKKRPSVNQPPASSFNAGSSTVRSPGDSIQQDMLAQLAHLSFSSQHNAPHELPGTRGHLTHNGQLVANKYMVALVREDGDVNSVRFLSPGSNYVLFRVWAALFWRILDFVNPGAAYKWNDTVQSTPLFEILEDVDSCVVLFENSVNDITRWLSNAVTENSLFKWS